MSRHRQVGDLGRWLAASDGGRIEALRRMEAALATLASLGDLTAEEQRDTIAMGERYGAFIAGCRHRREQSTRGWQR